MNVLKNLRIEKELTQQQAAKLLGISLRSYITYENDDTKSFKYYTYTNLSTKEKFNDYISNCKKYQLYSTGVSAVYGNQIITLTTCEYSQTNGRLVVVGKKVKTLSNTKK